MKTKENSTSVKEFINNVKNDTRRKDSETVLNIMKKVTGKRPKMWGASIVGFGKTSYKYASGKEGEICTIGFSPRSQALAFYGLTSFKNSDTLVGKLGKHKLGQGGCLYINKLGDVDLDVLESIIEKAYSSGGDVC